MTTTKLALPEKFRLVRNIEEGYEVHAPCQEHPDGHWVTITSVLHVLSPLRISYIETDAPDCIADLRKVSEVPSDELMSRRPAVTA